MSSVDDARSEERCSIVSAASPEASTPPSLPSLANELLAHIARDLYVGNENATTDLRALSLVSQRFVVVARRELFRVVRFVLKDTDYDIHRQLCRVVDNKKHSHMVVELVLLGHFVGQQPVITFNDVRAIVSALPSIRKLSISSFLYMNCTRLKALPTNLCILQLSDIGTRTSHDTPYTLLALSRKWSTVTFTSVSHRGHIQPERQRAVTVDRLDINHPLGRRSAHLVPCSSRPLFSGVTVLRLEGVDQTHVEHVERALRVVAGSVRTFHLVLNPWETCESSKHYHRVY